MRTDDARTGLGSGAPRSTTPYSVSVPHTFGTATGKAYWRCLMAPTPVASEVLAGGDAFDLASARRFVTFGEKGADEHDSFTLLARDLRPVIGVGGVREVLVLAELLLDRRDEVVGGDPLRAAV